MRARVSVLKTNIWLWRRSSKPQNAWWEEKKTEQCGTICLAMALGLKYALFTCWRAAQRLSQKGFDQWKLTTRLPDIWLREIWLRTIESGQLTPGQLSPDNWLRTIDSRTNAIVSGVNYPRVNCPELNVRTPLYLSNYTNVNKQLTCFKKYVNKELSFKKM